MSSLQKAFGHPRNGGRAGLMLIPLLAVAIILIIYFYPTGESGKSYTEHLIDSREVARKTVERANLAGIHRAMKQFAMMNEDKFPASKDQLASECGVPRDIFADESPTGTGIEYIPSQNDRMPKSNILLYEPEPRRDGTSQVLRLGGQVEMLTPEQLKTALEQTRKHIK